MKKEKVIDIYTLIGGLKKAKPTSKDILLLNGIYFSADLVNSFLKTLAKHELEYKFNFERNHFSVQYGVDNKQAERFGRVTFYPIEYDTGKNLFHRGRTKKVERKTEIFQYAIEYDEVKVWEKVRKRHYFGDLKI